MEGAKLQSLAWREAPDKSCSSLGAWKAFSTEHEKHITFDERNASITNFRENDTKATTEANASNCCTQGRSDYGGTRPLQLTDLSEGAQCHTPLQETAGHKVLDKSRVYFFF